MKRVSLIIPTYNEADNLPLLIEEILSVIDKTKIDLEFIVVDDNSPDGTGQIAEDLSKIYPVKAIHRSGKLGLGSAVREGFKHSDRPFLGVMDADLSHDPAILNDLILSLGEYDISLGSRFETGSAVENWVWWRKIISQIGVLITNFLTGVKDPLSGYFFLKREVIESVALKATGYKILLEMLIKGRYQKVKELSYKFRIRKFSASKLGAKEYWLFLKQIIEYSWYKILNNLWPRFKIWCQENKYLIYIMLFAAALLFWRVAYRTFWMDETMVLEYFKYSPGDFLTAFWNRPDNHPPLYYFLVLLISKILPWTELTVRLVSILAGLGIVWLVYVFTHRVTRSKNAALLAAFFTAYSSYFVLISQMARYHSLAAFSALLSFYFFYRLYFEGYSKRVWLGYLLALVLTGYVDYPHFIYVVLITNALFLYRWLRRCTIVAWSRWLLGQLLVAVFCLPVFWFVFHRVFIQGDGGWDRVNLLANSSLHLVLGILFHVYSFFFGENILPWNYVIFGLGCMVLAGMAAGLARAWRQKKWGAPEAFVILLSVVLIVFNTFFMNVADRRYNFIVYPKFVFVAYPFWVMTFVLCLLNLRSKTIKIVMFLLWGVVALFGLAHFYRADNYLNASYFRTFESFEYVRDNSKTGQYLAITPDAGEGLYNFYKQKYFANLSPLFWSELSSPPPKAQVWFFSTGSDESYGTASPESKIPEGYKILRRFDSVPLDPTLKKWKEKILSRSSYTYKYSVFLLEKL